MNEEGDRYGVCLQKLLTSRLLSGQTETNASSGTRGTQNMDDEMPEMDIEPISVGEDVPAVLGDAPSQRTGGCSTHF